MQTPCRRRAIYAAKAEADKVKLLKDSPVNLLMGEANKPRNVGNPESVVGNNDYESLSKSYVISHHVTEKIKRGRPRKAK